MLGQVKVKEESFPGEDWLSGLTHTHTHVHTHMHTHTHTQGQVIVQA